MKRSFIILMAASALAALSCTKEVNDQTAPEKEQVTMSFDATIGAPTKVEIGEANGEGGYKVLWSKGDKIAVYASDPEATDGDIQEVEFTTDIQSASAQATFTGEIDAAGAYYAVYPYEAADYWDEHYDNLTVDLDGSQKANGIASGISIATAKGTSLQFEHVTGYVKFTIPAEYTDIKEVRFSGNNGEYLAGEYRVYRDNGVTPNKFGSTKVSQLSLVPAEGNVFVPGTYYFTAFPAELTKGLTITFVKSDDTTASKSTDDSKSASVKAGDILNLGTISNLEFKGEEPPVADGDYAILVKVDESYKALSSTPSDSRLAAIDVAYDGEAEELAVSDPTAIWTFANNKANKYGITNSNKYLNHSGSSNSAKTTDDASECEVVDNEDGTYRIQLSSDQLRYLAYNSSGYFAFYGTTTSCDYVIYIVPAEYVQLPTITVNAEPEVIANNDTATKELSVSVTDATATSVKVYGEENLENEITWLTASYSAGKLTYSATQNTGQNERVAYVVVTASNENGQVSETIVVRQSGSVAYSTYQLLSNDIKNVNATWAYADEDIKTITAADGSVWKVYQTYRTAAQNTVQLKVNDGYLLSPTTSTPIKKIDITLKGSSNKAKLAIKTINGTELKTETLTTSSTTYSYDLTGSDMAVKFVSSNATIYIEKVVITY